MEEILQKVWEPATTYGIKSIIALLILFIGRIIAKVLTNVVRLWVKSSDYWNVRCDLLEAFKKSFDANGISIHYPQRDVHIYEHKQPEHK